MANTVPETAIAGKVVIAREEPPPARMALHAGYRLNDRAVFRSLGVEDITRDQNMSRTVTSCFPPDRIDGIEARLGKCGAHFRLKPPVWFSELPVGGVNELHCGPADPCVI